MKDKILERLKTECPFLEVFTDTERPEGSIIDVPRRKLGHLRADHDGYRWWNTWWVSHQELMTKALADEINRTYEQLIAKDALKDLPTLIRFCNAHPEACGDREFHQEYNFYLEGKACDFWVRLITRKGDYNMYLNAFIKEVANGID